MVQPTRKMLRGLRFTELDRYPLRVAVAPSHPLAGARTLNLAAVAREPLIGYSRKDYPETQDMFEILFKGKGPKPRMAEEHDSVTSLIAAVESGRGIALVPSCLECMVGARLKLIPLTPAGPPIVVGAAVRAGTVPAIIEKFIAAAQAK